MMQMLKRTLFVIAISALCGNLISCGGGSSDPAPTNDNSSMQPSADDMAGTVLTGVLVDSAVEGVSYSTATQSGTTNTAGEFSYLEGEQVTFSIGATELPTVDAAPQVSPVDMAAGSTNPEDTTTNIARLLQSLDSDGNPENGITVLSDATANASAINFDVTVDQFSSDPAVINLVANSGSSITTLIDAEDANQHLNETLGNTDNGNDQPNSSIVLDLRGTTWDKNREIGCDGLDNVVTFTYSDTEMSASVSIAEDIGSGCTRDEGTRGPSTFAEWSNTSAFLHVCGDDGQCTLDEVNREITVPVGDPRNDCTRDGVSVDVLHRISHVVDSGVITTYNCQPDVADVWTLRK